VEHPPDGSWRSTATVRPFVLGRSTRNGFLECFDARVDLVALERDALGP